MLCLDFSFTIFGNISQSIQEGIKRVYKRTQYELVIPEAIL